MQRVREITGLKKERIIQYGNTRIYSNQDNLIVERILGKEKIILTINMTDEKFSVQKEAENEEKSFITDPGMRHGIYNYGVQ